MPAMRRRITTRARRAKESREWCDDARTAQVAYARDRLLPIWELWTDGNPAMRRALECEGADPLTHEEQRNRPFATQQLFWGRGEAPSNVAPKLAAEACQFALLGYPLAMVEQIGARAEAAHSEALRLLNARIEPSD